jgi:hypothetical protein
MTRTIDDYDSMARREIIKAKQEKATSYVPFLINIPVLTCPPLPNTNHFDRRVQKFKSDYAEFRKEFERIKEEVSENPPQLTFTMTHFILHTAALHGTTHGAILHEHQHAPYRRCPPALCLIYVSRRHNDD